MPEKRVVAFWETYNVPIAAVLLSIFIGDASGITMA